jgi:hypothetical protein
MRLREITIAEIAQLDPDELSLIHDMIRRVRSMRAARKPLHEPGGAERVRAALSACRGSLSDDVDLLREDRV